METISEYTEQRIGHYRHYRLSSDRLFITQSTLFGARYEIGFMLTNVDPEKDTFWIFDQYKSSILALVFLVCLIPFIFLMEHSRSNPLYTVLAFAILLGPMIVGMKFNKRVEYSSFVSTTGNNMFQVGKIGRNKANYEEFVQSVVMQIKKHQGRPNQAL